MIKHAKPENPESSEDKKVVPDPIQGGIKDQSSTSGLHKSDSPTAMRDLLEKNLKWSQIIYEQNRKINSKLLWITVAGWVRVTIILIPLIAAAIFLPPYLREIKENYGQWISTLQGGKQASVNELINLLPLSDAERERIKGVLD